MRLCPRTDSEAGKREEYAKGAGRDTIELSAVADGKYRLDDYTTASVLSQIGWRRVLVEPADTSAKPSAGNGD
ncbi:MAG: hypothetical protein GF400_07295 [Candidatus Eisenbacteria bacterium]|nr:hypothetical protein [Candidatus Eisenbacteria bacterium]